jgi:hypothetical protein
MLIILAPDFYLLYSHASLCPKRAWAFVKKQLSLSHFILMKEGILSPPV